jgi:hypothetical protein
MIEPGLARSFSFFASSVSADGRKTIEKPVLPELIER